MHLELETLLDLYLLQDEFLRGGACGGADNGYVGAFGPAGGVDCGGVALAVLRQHPAAVEVVDLQAEECEGGEDLNPVAGGVGVGEGVSSKYLNNYLTWNNVVEHKTGTLREKVARMMRYVASTMFEEACTSIPLRPSLPILVKNQS